MARLPIYPEQESATRRFERGVSLSFLLTFAEEFEVGMEEPSWQVSWCVWGVCVRVFVWRVYGCVPLLCSSLVSWHTVHGRRTSLIAHNVPRYASAWSGGTQPRRGCATSI